MRAQICILLALGTVGCAPPRETLLNVERRPIAELATTLGFQFEANDLDEVTVGVAATLAVRACFPTNDAIAAVWWRLTEVDQQGDRAIVSFRTSRLVDREPDACLDRLAVLLPPGTQFGQSASNLLALMGWGRTEPHEALIRRLLIQMQVVQTLKARCFANQDPQGSVLLAWGANAVRVLDIRSGHIATNNACSRSFELTYPIDVGGHAMTPNHGLPLTEMRFSSAAYPIAETRAAWGVQD